MNYGEITEISRIGLRVTGNTQASILPPNGAKDWDTRLVVKHKTGEFCTATYRGRDRGSNWGEGAREQ
jgi:hypothetical protein